jgi:hypothetical protein
MPTSTDNKQIMFDLVTAHDFYAMLVEDFDDFMAEPHSARKALHCFITAHHLLDWVWHDQIASKADLRARFGVQSLKDFAEWVDSRSVWMTFVHEIANGTKHVRGKQTFDTLRVVAAPFMFDTVHAGFDEGAWDGPVRHVQGSTPVGRDGKGYLLIDFGEEAAEHRWLPGGHLLEVVVRFWRDFFRMYLPVPEVPASRHHVD